MNKHRYCIIQILKCYLFLLFFKLLKVLGEKDLDLQYWMFVPAPALLLTELLYIFYTEALKY